MLARITQIGGEDGFLIMGRIGKGNAKRQKRETIIPVNFAVLLLMMLAAKILIVITSNLIVTPKAML
jgi:hypothetical protein